MRTMGPKLRWIVAGVAVLALAFGAGWVTGRSNLADAVQDSVAALRQAVDAIDRQRVADSIDYALYRATADNRVLAATGAAARLTVLAGARLDRADSLAAQLSHATTIRDSLRVRELEVVELRAAVTLERGRGDSLAVTVGLLRETVRRADSLLALTRRSGAARETFLLGETARLRIRIEELAHRGKLFGLFPAPKCGPSYSAVLALNGRVAHGPGVSCVVPLRL